MRVNGQNVSPHMRGANGRVNVIYYTLECNRACFHPTYASTPRWNVSSLNNADVLQLPLLQRTTSTTPNATL